MLDKIIYCNVNYIVYFNNKGKTESAKYLLRYLTESYGAKAGLIETRLNECKSVTCLEQYNA